MTTHRTVTDMAGFPVHVGDTVAAAFRTYFGTYPQLRLGTVEAIVNRREPGRHSSDEKKEAIMVRWFHSSDVEEINENVHRDNVRAVAAGKLPRLADATYKEKTTPIFTAHKRFIRIG